MGYLRLKESKISICFPSELEVMFFFGRTKLQLMGTKWETAYSETTVAFIFVILLSILYCVSLQLKYYFFLYIWKKKIKKYQAFWVNSVYVL